MKTTCTHWSVHSWYAISQSQELNSRTLFLLNYNSTELWASYHPHTSSKKVTSHSGMVPTKGSGTYQPTNFFLPVRSRPRRSFDHGRRLIVRQFFDAPLASHNVTHLESGRGGGRYLFKATTFPWTQKGMKIMILCFVYHPDFAGLRTTHRIKSWFA